MLRTINTDVLIMNNISAHHYVILNLLYQKKYDVLDEYLTSSNTYEDFPQEVKYLKSKLLVTFNPDNSPYNYKSILVSSDSIRMLGNYNNFEEIYNIYPVKVRRPDGKENFLRRDRKTCEQLYNVIVKGSRDTHDHIVKCLLFELKDKEANGSLKFMKTLTNWLSDKEWRNYEDVVDDESYKKEKRLYGDTIE